MTQYSSQAGLGEPGASAKHLQGIAYAANFAATRMVTIKETET
jgi:hypothetical protein